MDTVELYGFIATGPDGEDYYLGEDTPVGPFMLIFDHMDHATHMIKVAHTMQEQHPESNVRVCKLKVEITDFKPLSEFISSAKEEATVLAAIIKTLSEECLAADGKPDKDELVKAACKKASEAVKATDDPIRSAMAILEFLASVRDA